MEEINCTNCDKISLRKDMKLRDQKHTFAVGIVI